MNIQADPVGYKALSRFFAASSRTDAEIASEVEDQGTYIRYSAYALIGLAFIATVTVLHLSRPIAMPVVLAIVVGLILGPIVDRLAQVRIPPALGTMALIIAVMGVMSALFYMVLPGVSDFARSAPKIAQGVDRIVTWSEDIFAVFDLFRKAPAAAGAIVAEMPRSNVDLASRAASVLTPAVSQFIIFLFTLMLFVGSRGDIRRALVMRFSDRERRLQVLRSFANAERKLTDFILSVSAVNAGLGLVVAALFTLVGIPGALVWGLMAFLANFLPVVGPLMIKLGLVVFGIATYDTFGMALMPLGVFLVISLVEANLITPKVVGERMTMSALMVFLSVVFWTWLWGFAGAFLAMPILAIISVLRDEFLDESASRLPG